MISILTRLRGTTSRKILTDEERKYHMWIVWMQYWASDVVEDWHNLPTRVSYDEYRTAKKVVSWTQEEIDYIHERMRHGTRGGRE